MFLFGVERVLLNNSKKIYSINVIRNLTSTLLRQNVERLSANKISLNIKILSCQQNKYFSNKSSSPNNNTNKSNILEIQLKKRPVRKLKKIVGDDEEIPQSGFWNVKGLATAEEYDLESLADDLLKQDLYIPKKINTSGKSESLK